MAKPNTALKLAFTEVPFSVDRLIIAGWAGRDWLAVQHHIAELAELGVEPPKVTPCFYQVGAVSLTTAERIDCLGTASSGEVEYFLYLDEREKMWVGVGSDHTDREAEAYSISFSKQVCPKPIASELWSFDEVEPHWDELFLRSWISDGEEELYQDGSIATLLHPKSLLEAFARTGGDIKKGTVIFGGTLPVIGKIRAARDFRMEIFDPVLKRSITHQYSVRNLATP